MTNPIQRKLDVKYDPVLALSICELIADGKTVVEVSETEGMPSRTTIYRWLSVYPKFFDAFERAREISAQSFEEEALTMARTLAGANDFTGTKVQAYNIAMQQLRWSASRRDKARYGQQVQESKSVPITIVTSLNLGQEGMGAATDIAQSVYTVTATIGAAVVEGNDDQAVEDMHQSGEVLDLTAEDVDNEPRGFGLPDEETQQLHNPPNGRPPKTRRKKGHKSAGAAARTASLYAKRAQTGEPTTEE